MPEDFYELLGVNRYASDRILRQAFHARLKEVHPDRNPDDAQACERTRRLVEAYKTLSNHRTRRRYNASITSPPPLYKPQPPPQQPPNPLFTQFLPTLLYIAVGLATAALSITIANHIP